MSSVLFVLPFIVSGLETVVTRSVSAVCTGDLAEVEEKISGSLDPSPKSPRQTMQVPDIEE
jgi:hypothetical protein